MCYGLSNRPLGDLLLQFDTSENVNDYIHSLDMARAVDTIQYKSNNIQFKREIFSSPVQQVMIMKLTADKPGSITFTAGMTREYGATSRVEKKDLVMEGEVDPGGVKFYSRIRFILKKGTITKQDNKIQIKKAASVLLIIAAASDYYGDNPEKICQKQIALF